MTSTTYADILGRHAVEVPAHLVADAEVPVLTGMQRQGDVLVVPTRKGKVAGLAPVPAEGIPVVRGEAGGNTHLLVAEGEVSYAPRQASRTDTDLGTLVVGTGTAWLLHPEHGAQGVGTGQYIVRQQRQQLREIERVRD